MNARSAIRVAIVVLGGLVFTGLVMRHADGVNGPVWWHWPWQSRPDLLRVAALLLLAALPALAAQWLPRRLQLAALAVSLVALQWMANAMQAPWRGVGRIDAVTRSWISNSYFSIAEPLVEAEERGLEVDWLGQYGEILRGAPLHAKTKPPVPIAFYATAIRLFGNARAPLAAAIAISLLSVVAVAAMWEAVRTAGGNDEAAMQGATLLALAPSMTLFFPALDVASPLLTCAILATWLLALERGRTRDAALFGLLLFAATMTSYSFLVLGAPLAIVALSRRPHALKSAAIGLGTCILTYALFRLATGFDPIASFRVATAMQRQLLLTLHRPYPRTIAWDLLDFALGSGWVPALLAALWFTRGVRDDASIAAIATPFIVAVTGLLATETARVWIFLMPLLMLPASRELAKWSRPARLAAHATMVVVTIALYANMRFIDPV